ncbi:MAG: phosphate acyltransferase PlsX [SAR202 cluster bacterium]|nr:phosphate acyltransferase PlsX [Chloroflexota bacterium]MDP6422883.1 phosphate acyltransferase PlsX [SAR202 cluster bacterium]HAL46959.1 phosphate acyltransferase PlsX [Dehalococcoidia bacterium]MDP6665461.1 phosphate acyltransferase PlsX [SAR202 cluster bacterium]MDP6798255.1 phosphate acyltransferase PlsX [SAR202 cluster bacterium]
MTAEQNLVRIAVDAMGGDNAPAEIVKGAVEFARTGSAQIMLVGDEDALNSELTGLDTDGLPVAVVPSEGVIREGEPPALALRQKPKASIVVSTAMVKREQADASVTMGSTGAAMAAAAVVLGMTKGVERPALGGPILGTAPRTVILDVGTNVDCRPQQLVSFAVIGDVFARHFWNIEKPRVALLSVGAEVGKGNRQVRETTELLEKSGLNFVGNVEAHELAKGAVDVAVCDGFVGNIVMKLTEGIGDAMDARLRDLLDGALPPEEVNRVTAGFHELTNVVEMTGGGPLFGVNGVTVVGHGSAKATAVYRAIGVAKIAVETGYVPQINRDLEAVHAKLDA